MRRRTMLMTFAGAGVGLYLQLPVKAEAENTSITQDLPDAIEAGPPDPFVQAFSAVRETLENAASWGLDVTEADSLCGVVLDRYRQYRTNSPALLQHCADRILLVSKGFAAMGKFRLAGLLDTQRVQLLEFVAGQKFSAAYQQKYLASDERSRFLIPRHFDRA
ncbi:MAG: hypothetical protein JNM43_13810 [Planctomycetaceae bacterium]|nr:hypothetical protein [Planctomycetaceae bacterium]